MMIKLFSITLAAIPISVLTLSYQDISQKPGGNVINTEREEKFSWKDTLLIVLGAGLFIIIVLFYCCIKKYKKQGFQQRHSERTPVKIEKLRKENAQLMRENERFTKENEQLKKEIERKKAQFKSAWREIPLYADWRKEEFQTVNLTLDSATAHPALFLSEEGRRVTWQEPCQELPRCSQRFVSLPCVLGQLHVSSGRYFWEVEVQNAHSWDLGVCRNNVARNGRVTMSPQNGFWAIRLYDGEYWGLTSPETSLTLKEKPCSVGVFLDYEAGDVSFYNMTDGSHIFTFSNQKFYGVLRPLFRLWSSDSGPLIIVQMEENTMML
ncbi:butyrophilin subfamily 1 member A1-like [Cervus elaphus]|uniref:butyrophilin subfamily 1 member A1-like n=1 Tax=Cervus elaphus TaxID=9860 RepID=UPI001CC3293B|nr:butyrophilin subfamily 1 member A1-like [Cervus elaphus]